MFENPIPSEPATTLSADTLNRLPWGIYGTGSLPGTAAAKSCWSGSWPAGLARSQFHLTAICGTDRVSGCVTGPPLCAPLSGNGSPGKWQDSFSAPAVPRRAVATGFSRATPPEATGSSAQGPARSEHSERNSCSSDFFGPTRYRLLESHPPLTLANRMSACPAVGTALNVLVPKHSFPPMAISI